MKSYTAKDVAELMRSAKDAKNPYVFFTGAGCSISAGVPSANSLVEEIKRKFPVQTKYVDTSDINQYGSYMSALDKNERRQLLSPYIIENKKINWAHIALACLIKEGFITRVLTFNFDSILSRACNLIGLNPSIYDFATASLHLYHLINDPSIVHLHGQGAGFIQLNTEQETKDHAQKMSDFVAAILNSNPSLFIGYSGNADAFFPLLEEKYSEQHRLIWTGRKKSIDELDAKAVKEFLKKNQNITHYIGEVDADRFLIQIAQHLECFPPEIIDNSAQHILNLFDELIDFPVDDEEYPIDILVRKRTALKADSDSTKKKNQDNLRGKLIRGKCSLTDIFNSYPTVETTNELDNDDKDMVASVYMNQGANLASKAAYANDENLFYKAIEKYDMSLRVRQKHIDTLNNRILAMVSIASIKKDKNLFDDCIKSVNEFLEDNSDNVNTIFSHGFALHRLAKLTSDEVIYKQSFEKYEQALSFRGDSFKVLHDYSDALLSCFNIEKDESLLVKAYELLVQAEKIYPGETYNFACYYSLTNQLDLCKDKLLCCEQASTSPKSYIKKRLIEDTDLDNVRNLDWFQELLARLPD